jgi:CRP-like cAMP-binding protein
MATPKVSRRVSTTKVGSDGDGTGNHVRNLILLGLPADEYSEVFKKIEFVDLPTHSVLHEAGERIKYAYFVNSGLASVLNVLSDGKSVEVGLAGNEGFVGLALVVGFSTGSTRVIMQVAGSAYRIAASDFAKVLSGCTKLEKTLNRYAQQLGMQATHVAACNRLHEVDERLARWLLMSQDRLGEDVVPLTQEFLAHMLGTRRASVTVGAGILQKAGLITYSRGSVKIDDRSGLEDASCECYAAMKRQSEKWENEAKNIGTPAD